jgi:DNA-binding MarR family transcriptional regulator
MDPAVRSVLDHWYHTDPDDRLAHLVRDVARGLKRSLQLRLSEHGVQFGHWAFLRVLWARDGLSQRELSEKTGLTESTTHTALNRMETLGLIRRNHVAGNRRRMHVFLTDTGRALEAVLVPLAVEVNDIAMRGLQEEQVELLRGALLRALSNLAEDELAAGREGRRITSTRDQGRL